MITGESAGRGAGRVQFDLSDRRRYSVALSSFLQVVDGLLRASPALDEVGHASRLSVSCKMAGHKPGKLAFLIDRLRALTRIQSTLTAQGGLRG